MSDMVKLTTSVENECQSVMHLDTVVLVGTRQHCSGLLLRATHCKQYLMRLGVKRIEIATWKRQTARLPRRRVLVPWYGRIDKPGNRSL